MNIASMNERDFHKLHGTWGDFSDGLKGISLDRICRDENKQEWKTLQSSFNFGLGRGYTEDVIVSEWMSTLLHKNMFIIYAENLMRDVQTACPGWSWIIMEFDAQIAKKKATHREMETEGLGRRQVDAEMRNLLIRMQSLRSLFINVL